MYDLVSNIKVWTGVYALPVAFILPWLVNLLIALSIEQSSFALAYWVIISKLFGFMASELHNSVNLFGTIVKELHSSLDLFGTLHKANDLQQHGNSSSSELTSKRSAIHHPSCHPPGDGYRFLTSLPPWAPWSCSVLQAAWAAYFQRSDLELALWNCVLKSCQTPLWFTGSKESWDVYRRSCFSLLLDCTFYRRVRLSCQGSPPSIPQQYESVHKQAMRVIFPVFYAKMRST